MPSDRSTAVPAERDESGQKVVVVQVKPKYRSEAVKDSSQRIREAITGVAKTQTYL